MSFLDDLFGSSESKSRSSETIVRCFTYASMLKYYNKMLHKIPGVDSCQISVCRESEYKKIIRPQDRWVISMVFCDAVGRPLRDPSNGQDTFGMIVIADSFDEEFSRFMNGRTQASFKPTASDMQRISEKKGKSLYQRIMDKLVSAFDKAVTPEFTVADLKNYRKVPGTKVIIVTIGTLKKQISARPSAGNINLSDFDEKDCIIAEYDERSDNIVQTGFINPDQRIMSLVERNNGVVIVED